MERLLQNGDKGRQAERKKREAELRKAEKRRKTFVNQDFLNQRIKQGRVQLGDLAVLPDELDPLLGGRIFPSSPRPSRTRVRP